MPNGRTLIVESNAIVALDVLGARDSAGPAQFLYEGQGVQALELTALSEQEPPARLAGALPQAIPVKTAESLAMHRGQTPASSSISAVNHARTAKRVPLIHEGG